MYNATTEFAKREAGRTGRNTHVAVKFVFPDGRQRLVKYSTMQDIEYYPASYRVQGHDMETLGIETLERKIVIKGYHLTGLFEQLEHKTIGVIAAVEAGNIRDLKQGTAPVIVSIDVQPLLFGDEPEVPDMFKHLSPPLQEAVGRLAASGMRM
jgi:hypothetical protein